MQGGERLLPLCPPFLPSVRGSASRAGPPLPLGWVSEPDCPLAAPPPRSAVPRTPTPALRGLPDPVGGRHHCSAQSRGGDGGPAPGPAPSPAPSQRPLPVSRAYHRDAGQRARRSSVCTGSRWRVVSRSLGRRLSLRPVRACD